MSVKNHELLVSIITPSYNQAPFLEQTILSVIDQDYGNIEYIVVDGGSTDGSVEIIQKYGHQLAWWVSEPDKGQGDAINKGLVRAQGEVVAWLNSDDVYLPAAVKQVVEIMQANPEVGLVYGNLQSIDSHGKVFNTITYQQYSLADLLAFRIIGQAAVFMRRAVLDESGILDPSYNFLLDHQLWLRIARLAKVKYVPVEWAAARHHPAAKNVAQAEKFGDEIFRILDWAKTQPDLAELIAKDSRRVEAGAQRLNGRYLLDGGDAGASLKAYSKALLAQPGYALQHWHRMLFALLSLFGLSGLRSILTRRD
jgi:glycosyltransferase involved in cell wall biosynthesis